MKSQAPLLAEPEGSWGTKEPTIKGDYDLSKGIVKKYSHHLYPNWARFPVHGCSCCSHRLQRWQAPALSVQCDPWPGAGHSHPATAQVRLQNICGTITTSCCEPWDPVQGEG